MAYEQKDNSGSLFPNGRKTKDTQPDMTGTIMVDGKEFWISGWNKNGRGHDFISLSVQPKEPRATSPQRSLGNKGKPADPISTGRPAGDMDEDSIPF